MSHPGNDVLRVANCSGFFGDRLSAAREMVEGGPVDVLTGDWLAELTMLILARQRLKHGAGSGYARTFLTQLEQVLGTCLDRGITVVSNAGGLDPAGCAEALHELAERLGLHPRIAHVTGDDVMDRLDQVRPFDDPDGAPLADQGARPLTANAYLGAAGIAAALAAGADVVVTGRVTDASLVVGPAAHRFGWRLDGEHDLDQVAGAVVAGHVLECGAQATGGNYAFFEEVPSPEHVGFPLAEISADGSSVITKHPGTGGLVSVGTVTAQLLYEIGAPAYPGPDVVAHFDTIALEQQGPDRVRISGVRGTPPPADLKVSVSILGGFRNTLTLVLTGLDLDAKAALVQRQLADVLAAVQQADVRRRPVQDGEELRITVKDPDPAKVGKPFTARVVELALASYPGFFPTTPPGEPTPYGVFVPGRIPAAAVPQHVHLDGNLVATLAPTPTPIPPLRDHAEMAQREDASAPTARHFCMITEEVRGVDLGRVFGARSGDKGGDANVGVWGRTDEAYAWLAQFLTAERVPDLLPETAGHEVEVHQLPNLRAVNVVVRGLLGRGVAENSLVDPQAKALGERLRAFVVELPEPLLDRSGWSP
ncbi:MAG TPA: acyclic terpene utilization AtuA family protein [Motilibacteraceae bacterium]|nr:acyclic terpene utilization AtuA family protein [Motilibacteraceae bacterium]